MNGKYHLSPQLNAILQKGPIASWMDVLVWVS